MVSLATYDLLRVLSAWIFVLSIVVRWWTGHWLVHVLWAWATIMLIGLLVSRQTLIILLVTSGLMATAWLWPLPWLTGVPDLVRLGLTVGGWSVLVSASVAGVTGYFQRKTDSHPPA